VSISAATDAKKQQPATEIFEVADTVLVRPDPVAAAA